MDWSELMPFAGWVIGGTVAMGIAGILGSIYKTHLMMKNGYPIEGMWGQSIKPVTSNEATERVSLLTQENAQLRAEIGSVKDRLANVERIVTDSGYRLTHEIDSLRDQTGAN